MGGRNTPFSLCIGEGGGPLRLPFAMVKVDLRNDDIRKEVWAASNSLCVDAPFENEPLIRQIINLRQEKAEILGKDNFADAVLARRMAKNGEKADQFISELREKTAPFFQKENQELEEFKAEKTVYLRS